VSTLRLGCRGQECPRSGTDDRGQECPRSGALDSTGFFRLSACVSQDFLNSRGPIDFHGADLPHWQQEEVLQFVTFRLGDSLPASKLRLWQRERNAWLAKHPEPWTEDTQREYDQLFTVRFEKWLDAGYGSCLLGEPKHRSLLVAVLEYDQPTRVELISWVVMPNHVHLLFRPKYPLPELIKSWKGISARRIGKGPIWQRNYRDTLIRDGAHLERVVRYIRRNPSGLEAGSFELWESERAKAIR